MDRASFRITDTERRLLELLSERPELDMAVREVLVAAKREGWNINKAE